MEGDNDDHHHNDDDDHDDDDDSTFSYYEDVVVDTTVSLYNNDENIGITFSHPELHSLIEKKQWQEAREYVQQHSKPQERLVIGKDTAVFTLCRTLTKEGPKPSQDDDDDEYSQADSDDYSDDDDDDDVKDHDQQVESFQRLTREACELATFLIESYAERRINPSSSLVTHHGLNGRKATDTIFQYKANLELLRTLLNNDLDPLPVQTYLKDQSEHSGATIVHYASEGRCPFSIHKLIMDLCVQSDPSILLMLDRDTETALHWALSAPVSQRRLQLYIRPETAPILDRLFSVPNQFGLNPLLVFWLEAQSDIRDKWSEERIVPVWDYVEMVTEMYLKAKGLEFSKQLPIHGFVAAFTNFCARGLLQYGLFLHNVVDPDENGLLPLHIACMCPALDPDIIWDYDLEEWDWDSIPDELLDKFPETASVECPQTQRLPLHWALERRASLLSLRLVTRLVGLCPAVLLKADPVTGLCTFLLAAASSSSSECGQDESARLDVVYYLLRSEPSIITALGF